MPYPLNANPAVRDAAHGAGHFLPRSSAPRIALGTLVFGILGFASFCAVGRIAETADPAMSLHGTQQLIMPWHDEALHGTEKGNVAMWKYRYRNAEGHMEDAPPAMNEHEVKIPRTKKA